MISGLIIIWAFLAVVVFGFSVQTMAEDRRYPFPHSLVVAAILGLLTPLVILVLGVKAIVKRFEAARS